MNTVLDMAVVDELLSLSDDGDPELLLDLIRLFLEDGPSKLAAVAQGLRAHDFEMMERAAHSLKGSSGNLGARRLQNTCELMQMATRNHDFAVTRELVPQMVSEYEEVRQALEELRQRYT